MFKWIFLNCLFIFIECSSLKAYARFSLNNFIRGYFLFDQESPNEQVGVTLGIYHMKKLATEYQIRMLPVGHNTNCSAVGKLWGYPEDPLAGDLSVDHGGKFQPATLLGRLSAFETFYTNTLSLSGPHSIINRSIAVYGDTPTRALGCATIISHPYGRVERFARFFTPLQGLVSFVQFGDEDTEVDIDLFPLSESGEFKIYISKPSDSSNPYNYHSNRVRTGDLSGKHFPLVGEYVRQTYEDADIQLSGNETISGMQVHVVNLDGSILATANIEDSYIWPDSYIYPSGPDFEEQPYYWQAEGLWLSVIFWLYISSVILLNIVWCVHRKTKLRYVNSRLNCSDNEMELSGFRDHKLGSVSFYALHSLDVVWFLVFFLGVSDWYYNCQLRSLESLCQIGSYGLFGHDANLKLMVITWTLGLVWFSFLLLSKNVLRNCYRQACGLADAEWVLVRVRNPPRVVATVFPSPIIRLYRKLCWRAHITHTSETLRVAWSENGKRYIMFRCCRLVYSDFDDRFSVRSIEFPSSFGELRARSGLKWSEANENLAQVGPNIIAFFVDPLTKALEKEFTRYFYLYQLMIYHVLMWYGYMFVAVIMILIIIGSAAASVYITRLNQKAIEDMTKAWSIVTTLRDGEWIQLGSTLLVPGDIVRLTPGAVACDLLLLEGTVVVDESNLTGESRPLRKSPLPSDQPETEFSLPAHASHVLFAGTRILQAENAQALVIGTGMNTSKGKLVEMILFPRPLLFKYDEEMVVVVGCLLVYGVVLTILTIWFIDEAGGESNYVIKFGYAVFTMNQVLNPLLPLSMVIGQTKASARLRKQEICCVEPARITISGKVRVFCFDKTGTLTKEGLDLIGVHENDQTVNGFAPNITSKPSAVMESGLACCHALTRLEGSSLVGNEVEASMFKSTGWVLKDTCVVSPKGEKLTIVKRFEFNHKRATMSVIVRDETGDVHVFCKGSSEAIGVRCVEGSLPPDYMSVSNAHALGGVYVLGLAHIRLGALTDQEITEMDQNHAEQNLQFLGLILFRNEVKLDTADTIRSLKEGLVRCVMITGDNAQCAYFVAQETAIVNENTPVVLAQVVEGKVQWKVIGTEESVSDPLAFEELAVTGEAFDLLCREEMAVYYLLHIRIFARMSPEGKMRVIEMLIAKGLVVGMCGDGGNDCGALRTAHVGIALSDAEASVVSPFTSKNKSIRSVLEVLLEGRCALVNSFANYKFLITYGLLFAIYSLVGVRLGTVLPQFDYIFLDLGVMMILSYTMSLSRPRHVLHPRRPTSALFGPTTMGSLLGLHVIQMLFLLFGFLLVTNNSNFVPWPAHLTKLAAFWSLSDNWESTVLFSFFVAQLSSSALIFSLGSESRQGIRTNKPLLACWLFAYGTFTLALLLPDSWFTRMFHIASHQDNSPHTDNAVWREWQLDGHETSPPMSFLLRFSLWCLITLSNVLGACWEQFVVMGPVARWFERVRPSARPVLRIGS